MSGGEESENAIERMNEYNDLVEHVRQLRKNTMEMNDAVEEMRWIAAGGRGTFDPDRWDRLVEASIGICEVIEGMDVPNPWEVAGYEIIDVTEENDE